MSAPVTSAHVLRVKTLYRHGLKNLMNWSVHRDLFIQKGFELRAEFDANKDVSNPRTIEKIVSAGEAKLKQYEHPDPYTLPHMPGGSKYMRHPNNGMGPPPEIVRIPSYIK